MPSATVNRADAIRHKQNELLYGNVVMTAAGTAVAAIVVMVFSVSDTYENGALLWYVGVNVAYAARLLDYRLFRRSTTAADRTGWWAFRFRAGAMLACIAWASSLWLIFPEHDRPHQVLLVLALGSVAGGAVASLAYDRNLNLAFQWLSFAAVEVRLLQQGDPFALEVAFYCLFVFGFMISCGGKVGRHYLELLRLKQDVQENNLTLMKTTERMARTGYWQWDGSSGTVELSENLARMWGLARRDVPARACLRLLPREDRRRVRGALESVFRQGEEGSVEHRVRALGGDAVQQMRQVIKPISDSCGRIRWLGTVQDITDIRAAERTIYEMAYRDELTGLANRARFHERLRTALADGERRGRTFCLVYIDLDDFKGVNDSYGHECGDGYLKAFAAHLRRAVRHTDFVARMGGDEFCALLEHGADEGEARAVAERVLGFSDRPVRIGNHSVHPRLSIGIARFPDDGHEPDAIVKCADLAMYTVKRRGKHGYAFYEARMGEDSLETARLESDFRGALERDEFELWYQPQIDLHHGRISGVEALIRWRHPERGLVFPDVFIDVAERIGMIEEIGEWVTRTACRQLADWKHRGYRLQMAVNVSCSHFTSEGFCAFVRDTARAHALEPGELEIEITESLSRDPDEHLRICRELRAAGLRVSIDDFGTGYSSLSVLQNLEIDAVKLDRSFIAGLPDEKPALLLVEAITRMSHSLGYDLVAEGVESREQLECLAALGCSHVQGYLFSRPVPAGEIPALIDSGEMIAQAA